MKAGTAAPQRSPRWQAGGVGHIDVGETHAFFCYLIDVRRCVAVIAIAAEVVKAQAVNIDVE
jgi:hypothetical protein